MLKLRKKKEPRKKQKQIQKPKLAMIGGGSWATAIIKILTNQDEVINWWIREPEIIENIANYKHNLLYLSSVELDTSKLDISNDINKVIRDSDVIIFCVPATFIPVILKDTPANLLQGKMIVSAIKGIVPDLNMIMGDFFHDQYEVPFSDIVVISGPSHAEEVALEKLTFLTVASQNASNAEFIASKLNCRYIKTSISDDIFGTEYSSVLKNIIAIANGICNGLGYGDNFQSVLISNAIQEIKRFVDKVHPIDRDINSSVYLGDLLVTAYSQFSRNRMFGNMIGKGYSVKFAQLEMKMIAEGYFAVKCIHEINKKHDVYMPITDAVYSILYEHLSPVIVMKFLSDKLN